MEKLPSIKELQKQLGKEYRITHIDWEKVVAETVPPKFRELNLKAYRAGYEAVEKAAAPAKAD